MEHQPQAGAANQPLLKIGDELKPVTQDEGSQRLVYFATFITDYCGISFEKFWRACCQGSLGPEVKNAVKDIPSSKHLSVVKELACIHAYLTMVEQGEDIQEWLSSFLATSVKAIDKILPGGTPIREVLQMHEFYHGTDVIPSAASNVCLILGMSDVRSQVCPQIEQFFTESTRYRGNLLRFVLTQPLDELQKHAEALRQ